MIGKIGSTGNSTGAHIHFMVIHDKNKDGNFEDNIPDGIVDPFGWQSQDPDPWEHFSFQLNGEGVQRTGPKSHYLWINKIEAMDDIYYPDTSSIFQIGKYSIQMPEDIHSQPLNLTMNLVPSANIVINDTITHKSITTPFELVATNLNNQPVTQFDKAIEIIIDFLTLDLTPYDPDTIQIYSSRDGGQTWDPEDTTIDWETGTAMARVDHLTQFALMGKRKDTTAATS